MFLRPPLISILCSHLKRSYERTWRLAATELIFSIDLKGNTVKNRWINYLNIDRIRDDKYHHQLVLIPQSEGPQKCQMNIRWVLPEPFNSKKDMWALSLQGYGTVDRVNSNAYLIDSSGRVFKQLFCTFYAHLSCSIQQNLPAIHELI